MIKRAAKSRKEIPSFANEDQERRFWAKQDAADYFDWEKAVQPALPNLKPTTTAISIRLPVAMLEDLKSLANKRDVPYQSLMKLYLSERIGRERMKKAS
jgi:predicted DNA binding CopG/RHH family protein